MKMEKQWFNDKTKVKEFAQIVNGKIYDAE